MAQYQWDDAAPYSSVVSNVLYGTWRTTSTGAVVVAAAALVLAQIRIAL